MGPGRATVKPPPPMITDGGAVTITPAINHTCNQLTQTQTERSYDQAVLTHARSYCLVLNSTVNDVPRNHWLTHATSEQGKATRNNLFKLTNRKLTVHNHIPTLYIM